ncbi:MAG: hypothetical protein AB7O59_12440 [Pirellulales bacterium]
MTTSEAARAVAEHFEHRLELFFGAASDTVAHVYARLAAPSGVGADTQELTLSGSLYGPECQYAATLPARFKLVDRGPGPSLLAAATVPEPCFWTPDLPHWYRAEVELRRGAEVLARASRLFGIRPLGAAGGKLIYDATRWMLRGVICDEVPQSDLAAWRDARAAMVVPSPTDALCEAASHAGVLLVAVIDAPDAAALRRMSRWPAVGMVVLPAARVKPALPDHAHRRPAGAGPNLLLAVRGSSCDLTALPPWIDAVLVDVDSRAELTRNAADRPALIAMRPGGNFASVAEARTACDRLQHDLATRARRADCDWSGYIV